MLGSWFMLQLRRHQHASDKKATFTQAVVPKLWFLVTHLAGRLGCFLVELIRRSPD